MKEDSEAVIIGNGASLLGKGLGNILDSYQEVVRFNEFKISGFERDVGTRTTTWFYNRDTSHSDMIARLSLHKPLRMYIHEWTVSDEVPLRLKSCAESSGVSLEIRRVRKQTLADMTAFLGERYNMWSTGAIATWMLLQEVKSVALAGFDWWHNPPKFHYMNAERFCLHAQKGHQPLIEKRFYERIAKTGRLHFIYE